MTRTQIDAALRRARRHHRARRTEHIRNALHAAQLAAPPATTSACGVLVRSIVALITALNAQVDTLAAQVEQHFDRHPTAGIYRSQPGVAAILGPRLLGEFGDGPAPLCQREGAQELRRDQPDHAAVRVQAHRVGPVRAQRPAR